MTGDPSLLVLGVDVATTSLWLRERATTAARGFLSWVAETSRDAIGEAFVLATCHRVEFYVASPCNARAESLVRRHLVDVIGDGSWSASAPYRHLDEAAVRHLARVAGGLQSMVLGESEIAGQVRRAVQEAQAAGVCGPVLGQVAAGALRASGRIRQETALARGARSLAGAAVQWATGQHPRVADASVLIVGAGAVGREAVARLARRRPAALVVASRSMVHARQAASGTHASILGLDQVRHALSSTDVLIVGLRTDTWHIDAGMLAEARRTRQTPMWIADVSVPRVVQPEVSRLPGVHLATVDDLGAVAEASQRRRRAAVPHAMSIAEEEARWTFARLRARVSRIAESEVA